MCSSMESTVDVLKAIIIFARVTADYYYPEWGHLVNFFAIWGWKIAGMGSWGLNPQHLDHCSQSGAFDLSATAMLQDKIL